MWRRPSHKLGDRPAAASLVTRGCTSLFILGGTGLVTFGTGLVTFGTGLVTFGGASRANLRHSALALN